MDQLRIPGRPRCTTRIIDQRTVALAERHPLDTGAQLRARWTPLRKPSVRTLLRRLRERGVRNRVQRRKDLALAKPSTRNKRLDWCMQQIEGDWSSAQWAHDTVWIDECAVSSCTNRRRKAWRSPHARGLSVQLVQGSGRITVSVLGGLCGDELLLLYVVHGHYNAAQHRDVLAELYWPVLQEKFADRSFRFVQDNSPIHRGRAVSEWLEQHAQFSGAVVNLPPYSPDLNPIEHVWARLKFKMRDETFRTRDALTARICEVWEEIGEEKAFLTALTSSMPPRMRQVIVAEGGPTRY